MADRATVVRDRTAASWFDGCLPRDLFEETEGYEPQHLAVLRPTTLVSRPPPRVATARVRDIYSAMSAAAFKLPRVFDTNAGHAPRHSAGDQVVWKSFTERSTQEARL